jgi:pimeloyl-ACP methyl ester carboxylesterase
MDVSESKEVTNPDNSSRLKQAAPRRIVKRLVIMVCSIVLGFLIVLSALLFLLQRRIIYHPHAYEPSYKILLPPNAVELNYRISSGQQVSFYIPSRADPTHAPEQLWLLFNGNAALGLDLLDFVKDVPDENAGFLFMDYPGYGACAGKPTRKSILASTEAAFGALSAHLKLEQSRLEEDLNVLGFSIGTAAALEFAARHPVKRVVLVAPFTSMLEMARLSVGTPLCHMLIDRYDNRARLAELAARDKPPTVHIFHGDADETVPFRMGAELAQRHPGMIVFHAVNGASHDSILDVARHQIFAAMTTEGVE